MRFSDIKKFWEAHLGGHGTKSSQTRGSATPNKGTGPSPSKKASVGATNSTRARELGTGQYADDKNDVSITTVHGRTETASTSARFDTDSTHRDVIHGITYVADVTKSDGRTPNVHCDDIREPVGGRTNMFTACSDASVRSCVVHDQSVDEKQLQDCSGRFLDTEIAADIKAAISNSVIAERYVLNSTTVPAIVKHCSPKKRFLSPSKKSPYGLIKTLKYFDRNQSEPHLEECGHSPNRCPSCQNSTSAPPSVNSSPRRVLKGNSVSRTSLHHVKFNEVHNFWKMREKKLVKRSVQERSCLVCGCYLSNSFYEQDCALYCEEDFWIKYGQCCKKCSGIITGPIMIAGLFRFHPECFECSCCKRCISDGDLYALVLVTHDPQNNDSVLFCCSCYQGLRRERTNAQENDETKKLNCTVVMVIDFYATPTSSVKQTDARQAYTAGHGITVKDLPLAMSVDGLSQPTGQLVCDVHSSDSCSLLPGDVILQVNGLAVDLNALVLIDRLFDDIYTPLKLTIQREVDLSSEMCFGLHLCTHRSPQVSPCKTPSVIPSSSEPTNDFLFEVKQPVNQQPQIPVGCSNVSVGHVSDATTESQAENNLEIPLMSCNPFSFSVPESLCCKSQPQCTYSTGDELVVVSPPATDCQNSDSENLTSVSSHNTTADSGVEEDNCPSDRDVLSPDPVQTFELDYSLSDQLSSLGDGWNLTGQDTEKDEKFNSITFSNAEDTGVNECAILNATEDECTKNLSIIQQSYSSESSTTALLTNTANASNVLNCSHEQKETDSFAEMENAGEANNHTVDAAETLNPLTESSTIPEETVNENTNFERLPSIAPRSKRHGIKRKSPCSNASGQDDKDTVDIPKAIILKDSSRSDTARRSNSLRTDIPYVHMRQSSPRGWSLLQKSTFSVYNPSSSHTGGDLSRSESMRIYGPRMSSLQRVFRPCDLIHGEVLGQGFFGKAIKVTHRDTGEVMVLKVLNSLDQATEKSFLKEVKVMRNLFHRNVIRFIGVLYKDKRLNIITEFVECGTLKDVLTNMEEELPWQQRVFIARDITSGMSYLHSMNIIHRDLNSGNCFVKNDGTVVVADFGLARVHSKSASLGRRKRYTMVGNPYWMAPEMLNRNFYDERVDIFSFGIVLCEVIGRIYADPDYLPRSNDFGLAVLAFHSKFCESCPAFLFAIAVQASSLNPDDRPSFQELAGWFEMLAIREELSRLPDPPHLQKVITSVYSKYDLPLPVDMYSPPVDHASDPGELVRSTSVSRIASVCSEKEADHNTLPRAKKRSSRGTGFFAKAAACTRL